MPLIEVDEDELRSVRGAKQLLDSLANDPKTRSHLLGLVKLKNPDANIPEIDVPVALAGHVDAKMRALEEKVNAATSARAERDANDEVERVINRARRKLQRAGHSAENISAIEKLMQDEGIASYDAAEALWERRNPPPSPADPDQSAAFGGKLWNFAQPEDNDEDHKLLMKNPKAFSDRVTRQMVNEFRQARAGRN